jgi:alpha-beta hydrolase superfamily lysophospholipase
VPHAVYKRHVTARRPFLGYWPEEDDEPQVTLGREPVALVSPDGAVVRGVFWTPPAGTPWRTAVVLSHPRGDFGVHYACPLLAAAGYGVFGFATRYVNNDTDCLHENCVVDVATAVEFVRERGADAVVLLGNSGGGSLMAAYQSQAAQPNVRPAAGMRPLTAIEQLPAADLFVALAAHSGRPEVLTNWLDASVTDEADPLSADPALDPFSPDNGPPYSTEFQQRYRAAQRARNERITDWALARLAALDGTRARDRLFTLYRTWADLRMIDPAIEPSDRRPNWCYLGEPVKANYGVFGIGTLSTLRSWLSMWSLRTSQCTAAPHLARITVPSLVVHASADACVYESDARALLAAIGAADKRLEFIKADHYLLEPDGARTQAADLIAAWVAEH